ncbi:enoyl-CoA hydratase-related protein [Janibacter cremeus]|uniref:2-(1,2-epoxy-1,2-dihydrophenyl)acetyl-CoA isomerase n=1 Tax=Janibacter cremeus TaxID=1285192 RepID=A0A852VLL4_9MICO|nr:2-(1,2-epoxy-1,2-dihydrophenyl)acetyl-CoA isomerase [Janibacter cremeus]
MGVTYEASNRLAQLVLDRPEAGNALDLDMARELHEQVRRALADPYVDILTLTANGSDFCVGSDTSEAEQSDDPTTAVFELAAALEELFTLLNSSAKLVLVGVQGLAAGSGLGLVLAGDLAFSSGDASFRVPPKGGTGAPDPGLAWLLPRAIGQQRALSFGLGGRTLDAATADGWGIAELAPDGDVPAALRDAAENLGGKHLWANSEMRRLLHASWETSRTELSQSEAVTLVRALLNRQQRR